MPLYDYICAVGHRLCDVRAKADGSDAPNACPSVLAEDSTPDDRAGETTICARPLRRLLSAPASVFPGAASWRK